MASLQASYFDIPLAAQQAVLGRVFIDKDGDGQFDPQKDEAIEGAHVTAGAIEVMTGPGGVYILRDLPAGKLTITACAPTSQCSTPSTIELDAEPATRRSVNFIVPVAR